MKKTRLSEWPSDEIWKVVEKKLKKLPATKLLSSDLGPVQLLKHSICRQFIEFFNASEMTQKDFAKQLGVTESRVSEILNYHYQRFTIDKLLGLLSQIKPKVKVSVA